MKWRGLFVVVVLILRKRGGCGRETGMVEGEAASLKEAERYDVTGGARGCEAMTKRSVGSKWQRRRPHCLTGLEGGARKGRG